MATTKRVVAKKAAKKAATKVAKKSVVAAVAPVKKVAAPVAKPARMEQGLVNHIVFAIDNSGSMARLESKVKEVFDGQIAELAAASKELGQETRVSIYIFDNDVRCLIWDKDVRLITSIKEEYYNQGGYTALLDATSKAIDDLKLIPEIYGDHAFLLYVLTDGQEYGSRYTNVRQLQAKIASLPDNWTLATMVPDKSAINTATAYGFPADNCVVWGTNERGVSDLGAVTKAATRSFMTARASGVRSTKTLFQMNTQVAAKTVKTKLDALDPKSFTVLIQRKEKEQIRDFVESWLGAGTYVQGCAYYRLEKKETVQAGKELLLREKKTGKVFGGDAARQLLGLPSYEVKVAPTQLAGYDIFIQSTSTNRNIFKDTIGTGNVIVML